MWTLWLLVKPYQILMASPEDTPHLSHHCNTWMQPWYIFVSNSQSCVLHGRIAAFWFCNVIRSCNPHLTWLHFLVQDLTDRHVCSQPHHKQEMSVFTWKLLMEVVSCTAWAMTTIALKSMFPSTMLLHIGRSILVMLPASFLQISCSHLPSLSHLPSHSYRYVRDWISIHMIMEGASHHSCNHQYCYHFLPCRMWLFESYQIYYRKILRVCVR